MTMTTYDIENQVFHQASLVAGTVTNTANLWSGLFWATATMGMRLTEQSMRATGMLLNTSYQTIPSTMANITPDTPMRRNLTIADVPTQPRVRVFAQEQGTPEADAAFYFRGPVAEHNLRVDTLEDFVKLARQVDDATWHYHLQRGDYSHWFRTAVLDETLAAEAMLVEKLDIPPQDSRERLLAAVTNRYTITI